MNVFLKTLGLESMAEKEKQDDSKPTQLFNILMKQRRTSHLAKPKTLRSKVDQ